MFQESTGVNMRNWIKTFIVLSFIIGCASQSFSDYILPGSKGDSKSAVLKGRITDENGKPIPDVVITIYSGYRTVWPVKTILTNAKGEYQFDPSICGGMVSGDFTVSWYSVKMKPYHPRYASTKGTLMWNFNVFKTKDNIATKDFTMVRAGSLSGFIRSKGAHPVGNIGLRIIAIDGRKTFPCRYITTDGNGYFAVHGLYPRKYEIDIDTIKPVYPIISTVKVEADRITNVPLALSNDKPKTKTNDPPLK
jgi:hypothetical protein